MWNVCLIYVHVRYNVVARPSVCRLSVCNVRVPYSGRQATEIFGNVSTPFGTLAIR